MGASAPRGLSGDKKGLPERMPSSPFLLFE